MSGEIQRKYHEQGFRAKPVVRRSNVNEEQNENPDFGCWGHARVSRAAQSGCPENQGHFKYGDPSDLAHDRLGILDLSIATDDVTSKVAPHVAAHGEHFLAGRRIRGRWFFYNSAHIFSFFLIVSPFVQFKDVTNGWRRRRQRRATFFGEVDGSNPSEPQRDSRFRAAAENSERAGRTFAGSASREGEFRRDGRRLGTRCQRALRR